MPPDNGKKLQELRALMTEARKFWRKVLLVTTDWRVYEGIAKVFKPKPWEPSAATWAVSAFLGQPFIQGKRF